VVVQKGVEYKKNVDLSEEGMHGEGNEIPDACGGCGYGGNWEKIMTRKGKGRHTKKKLARRGKETRSRFRGGKLKRRERSKHMERREEAIRDARPTSQKERGTRRTARL